MSRYEGMQNANNNQAIDGEQLNTASGTSGEDRNTGTLHEDRSISDYVHERLRRGERLNVGEGGAYTIGRDNFNWREELSEPAKAIYPWLLREMGHPSILTYLAEEYNFDLDDTLAELRAYELIETHPRDSKSIRIIRRRLD